MMDNTDKSAADKAGVAFVTGAAGGLGRALVEEFVKQGWKVVAACHVRTDKSEVRAESAKEDVSPLQPIPVSKESGVGAGDEKVLFSQCERSFAATERVLPVAIDVADKDSVERAVAEAHLRWGRLDVLVNNAGITADKLVAQISEEEWDRVQAVNLKGAFLCSQAVLRSMLKRREGHIINISSHSARAGRAGQGSYAASKAGLIGLTQSLAREAGSRNVRVNAILPGVLPTRMTAGLGAEVMKAFAGANALGRINEVEEVAKFVVFLAGTRNISGQCFQLDSRVGRWT